jgi:hypothetical protein
MSREALLKTDLELHPRRRSERTLFRQSGRPDPIIDSAQTKKFVGIVTDRDLPLKTVADGRDATSI